MGSIQDDDDVPQLSTNALSALQEFLGERDQHAKQFEELKAAAEDEFIVSAPSVFIQLKNLLRTPEYKIRPEIKLLEFDERFGVFKEWIAYDLAYPTRLHPSLKGQFDRIICDPPFLSADCQTKAAVTVRWLAKSWDAETLRLIVCTGERMEGMIGKLYGKAGVKTTDFEIQHAKGLSNEFLCYANYESAVWRWRAQDESKQQE
ncbi:DNA methylase N-6 adenine-specific conserved site [Botryosphaeria dothidea]|uniref:DNA methylase N-6 adenine-specific conserved site n=1 Tax=Botryosphaeria dothidea TaxID=55169 RepID=A0A8H4N3D3_9PEZI|nr:DNA methylase N-6 adenine-specific conserved site [Botryosphaeria dothidea]